MRRLLGLVFSVLLLCPAGTASAATSMPQMDANGDGVITLPEALAFLQVEFNAHDVNHDGYLDFHELTAPFLPYRPTLSPNFAAQFIAYYDLNRDGRVSFGEIEAVLTGRAPHGDDSARGIAAEARYFIP